MRTVHPGGFVGALRALDRDALAAFVAELWAAGGWETSVEGPVVVAERSGQRRRVVVVAAGRGLDRLRRRLPAPADLDVGGLAADLPAGDDPDVVVDASGSGRVAAAARAAGARYVPPEDLRDRLLYGVPREVGADLSERHLDRSLQRPRNRPSGLEGGRSSRHVPVPWSDGRVADSRTLLLGAVLAVLVVGTLAAGSFGLLTGGPGPTGAPAADVQTDADGRTSSSPPAMAATATTAGPATAAGSTATETDAGSSYPPGLSSSGVENVSVLTDAHVVATRNRRYAFDGSFDGPAAATGFGDFSSVRWSLVVEGRHHFSLDVSYRRAEGTDPQWVRRGLYADGAATFRRTTTPNGTQYAAVPAGATDARSQLYFASTLIERYLDTTAAVVRPVVGSDGPRYHVVARGTPTRLADSVVDYRAEALVTPAGRVTMLEARYTVEADGVERQVQVGFDYGDYGTARVDPPDWYDEARNETGG